MAAALLLVALAAAAYIPALGAGFVWDDDHYVTENATLREAGGLWRIWFEIGAVPQYYPLVHSSFWLEYRLWGLHPAGFHTVNVLLHALSGIVLWRLLRRLSVPGAWVAAAVFLLHPVHVESVAWITARKNVLSGLFYLLAASAWVRSRNRERLFQPAVLGLFLLALASKTITASLPVALLIVTWWKRGRIGREAWSTLPMFVVGATAGLFTVWMERNFVGAVGARWSLDFVERGLVAGRALWFYLEKLVWPHPLLFIYPRWTIDAGSLVAWLYPLGAVAAIAGLWAARRRLGRGPFAAALFFTATLGPALGFLNVYPMRYSFVADHFQYLASIGPICLAVGALAHLSRSNPRLGRVAAALVLLLFGSLTWRHARDFEDAESLWTATLVGNPQAHIARNNLGGEKLRQSSLASDAAERERLLQEARTHLEIAAGVDYPEAHNNLGIVLHRLGRPAEAVEHYRTALSIQPRFADAANNLGISIAELGRLEEATRYFAEAVRIDPLLASARYNLAAALVRLGRREEALPHLDALERIDPRNASARQLRQQVRVP